MAEEEKLHQQLNGNGNGNGREPEEGEQELDEEEDFKCDQILDKVCW